MLLTTNETALKDTPCRFGYVAHADHGFAPLRVLDWITADQCTRTGLLFGRFGGEGDDSGQQHHDDGGREEQVIAEAMLEGVHQ